MTAHHATFTDTPLPLAHPAALWHPRDIRNMPVNTTQRCPETCCPRTLCASQAPAHSRRWFSYLDDIPLIELKGGTSWLLGQRTWAHHHSRHTALTDLMTQEKQPRQQQQQQRGSQVCWRTAHAHAKCGDAVGNRCLNMQGALYVVEGVASS